MSIPSILYFSTIFTGMNIPSAHSNFYEECILLSKNVKLLIITQKKGKTIYENISVIEIPKIIFPVLVSLQKFFGYLIITMQNKKNYDIVFTRIFRSSFLIPAIIAKKLFKKKLVVWVPGSYMTKQSRIRIHRYIIKTALRVADIICAASEQVIVDVEKNLGGMDRSKVKILPEPINISIFSQKKEIPNNNNILSVSRIIPLKGIEKIINSLPLIVKKIPNTKFIHIGPIEDKKYFEMLKKLISNLDCEKYVEFHGPIPKYTIVDEYNAAKIFLLTSKSEGLSLATKEAMSCGKPVVVTPVGAIPDYVKDGENGFLLKKSEPKEIAEIIIRLLEDDKLRENIGTKARRTIEELSSQRSYEDELASIFNKLLSSKLS